MKKQTYSLGAIITILSFLALQGCATVGHSFQFQGPESITVGKTAKADLIAQYGNPFRVGYENGFEKWTYGFYEYKLFGDSQTKDLDVNFDKKGIVTSYSYSSSVPDEVKKALK